MAWTEINGQRIRYRHYPAAGPGGQLLMLHMAGSSSVAWSAVARRLAHSVEVFAPDLPGHGQSDGEPLDSIAAMAAFAGDFIEHMQLGPVFVAGHSMGGAVALQLALDTMNREHAPLRGLILVSTGAQLPVARQIFDRLDRPEELGAMIAGPALQGQGLSAQVEVVFPQTNALGLRRDFSACSLFDLRAPLAQINVATLVMVGRNDAVTPPALAQDLAEGLPAASLEIVEGAGHMLPREKPAQVAQHCAEFLRSGLKF